MSPQDSTAGGSANRYYGKYRGLVINNIDPLQIGRVMVQCADVLGEIPSSWALPCVPAAGIQAGMFIVPPIGSQVWVEFEGGEVGVLGAQIANNHSVMAGDSLHQGIEVGEVAGRGPAGDVPQHETEDCAAYAPSPHGVSSPSGPRI